MFGEIDKFYEPVHVLNTLENGGNAGMSENELAFLSGCIKKYKPRKLVEVGTSAGGTMAVIMECCRMLKLDTEIFSVDISKCWYIDPEKETGYVIKELKKKIEYQGIRHTFVLGETLGGAIEKIGNSIDFIILDTMHSLPGELLDFISAAKWMSKNALVVFHDVGQCQLGIESMYGKPFEYASVATFSCLCGKKYWNRDIMNYFDLSNIGAVELSDNFFDYIDNLFAALFINWDYIPDSKSLNEYRERINKDYGEKYLLIFEQALASNEYSLYKRGGMHIPIKRMEHEVNDVIEKASNIYVYGNGIIGNKVSKYVQVKGKKVSGYITTLGGQKV